MKTIIRFFLGVLIVLPAWITVRGQEPATPRRTGNVLLLENEHVYEGEIEREGNQYRVRRPVGEIMVPAESALCVCENMQEAYEYLRARSNSRDVDERLRLARWCHLHALPAQALAEATAALELKPSSRECQRWVQIVQRAPTTAHSVATAARLPETLAPAVPPTVEISAESLATFVTRVQPILMNTCASCHATGHGGNFRLVRVGEGADLSRRATQQNLAAVMAEINNDRWEASLFLTRSVSVHGEAGQPPLKNRQAHAFKSLEDWVRNVIATNPQLQERTTPVASVRDSATAATTPRASPEPTSPNAVSVFRSLLTTPSPDATREVSPAALKTQSRPTAAVPIAPAPVSASPDPYDPSIFNQANHP